MSQLGKVVYATPTPPDEEYIVEHLPMEKSNEPTCDVLLPEHSVLEPLPKLQRLP